VNYFWIVVVLIIGIMSHVTRALRWQMLLEPVGTKPSLKNTFLAVMTGYFANLAFPRLGEVTRCGVLLTTDKIPVSRSLGTVVTERGIDLLIFILLFVALVFSQYNLLNSYLEENVYPGLEAKFTSISANHLLWIIILFLAALGALFILLIRKAKPEQKFLYKIKSLLLGFWGGLKSIGRIRRPWLFVFYSLLIWLCYFLMTWLCFRALEATSGLSLGAGLAVLMLGGVGIMITPGGIGLYPVIARDTMILYGIISSTGFAMGWILWTSQTAMIIVTGLGSLIWLSMIKKRANFTPGAV
jgi:uncharacterized protein (TIRG00374 family)